MLKYAQHCSGETIARISSSVGSRKSGLITHQLESMPKQIQLQLPWQIITQNQHSEDIISEQPALTNHKLEGQKQYMDEPIPTL
jgi:hypothetical protein